MANRSGLYIFGLGEISILHEITPVVTTLESGFTEAKPVELVGDKAYVSEGLDIKTIAPRKADCIKRGSLNRITLQYFKKRRDVKRLFTCLGDFRHILTHYGYIAHNFFDLVQLFCIHFLLKQCSYEISCRYYRRHKEALSIDMSH